MDISRGECSKNSFRNDHVHETNDTSIGSSIKEQDDVNYMTKKCVSNYFHGTVHVMELYLLNK